MQHLVKQESLDGRVELLGNRLNVGDYLKAADIFIMPSLWEGLPIALLEAASYGLLIITTDVGGNPEIITDELNGFLVPPKDQTKLAEKIKFVVELPVSEKRSMGKAVRSTIQNEFSLGHMIHKYEQLYSELLFKTRSNSVHKSQLK